MNPEKTLLAISEGWIAVRAYGRLVEWRTWWLP